MLSGCPDGMLALVFFSLFFISEVAALYQFGQAKMVTRHFKFFEFALFHLKFSNGSSCLFMFLEFQFVFWLVALVTLLQLCTASFLLHDLR